MKDFFYEYIPEAKDTCKSRWRFHIVDGRFDSIDIEGEHGCKGHPQTIGILLRGRRLDAVDADALATIACDRGFSCGKALAEAITRLRKDIKT